MCSESACTFALRTNRREKSHGRTAESDRRRRESRLSTVRPRSPPGQAPCGRFVVNMSEQQDRGRSRSPQAPAAQRPRSRSPRGETDDNQPAATDAAPAAVAKETSPAPAAPAAAAAAPAASAMRPGDWICPKCKSHNFATKTACYMCREPRPASGELACLRAPRRCASDSLTLAHVRSGPGPRQRGAGGGSAAGRLGVPRLPCAQLRQEHVVLQVQDGQDRRGADAGRQPGQRAPGRLDVSSLRRAQLRQQDGLLQVPGAQGGERRCVAGSAEPADRSARLCADGSVLRPRARRRRFLQRLRRRAWLRRAARSLRPPRAARHAPPAVRVVAHRRERHGPRRERLRRGAVVGPAAAQLPPGRLDLRGVQEAQLRLKGQLLRLPVAALAQRGRRRRWRRSARRAGPPLHGRRVRLARHGQLRNGGDSCAARAHRRATQRLTLRHALGLRMSHSRRVRPTGARETGCAASATSTTVRCAAAAPRCCCCCCCSLTLSTAACTDASKAACFGCGGPREPGAGGMGMGGGMGGGGGGGSGSLPANFRPGDWMCPKCSSHNYSSKAACFRCNELKPPGM
jgi:predicted nucleic-acid-binding Zn-ribbon protein